MILEIRPVQAGNALQFSLEPPAGSLLWRVLRKATNDFVDENDAVALKVYEGTERHLLDAAVGLINETPAYYKAFYWNGDAWTGSTARSGTPRASYEDNSTDVQALVRDRLEAGLAVEIAREVFKPNAGHIRVLTAPPTQEATDWPVVTVSLVDESSGARGLGELVEADEFLDPENKWGESEGWLASVTLEVTAWCLNSDERIALRQAVRRILIANLAVFDAAGMVEINVSQRDMDFLNGEFGANVFTSALTFTCQAPVIVSNKVSPIADITVTADVEYAPAL
jgi:hypothetical protein